MDSSEEEEGEEGDDGDDGSRDVRMRSAGGGRKRSSSHTSSMGESQRRGGKIRAVQRDSILTHSFYLQACAGSHPPLPHSFLLYQLHL